MVIELIFVSIIVKKVFIVYFCKDIFQWGLTKVDMIDNPIDYHKESTHHKESIRVKLSPVQMEKQVPCGTLVRFSEYFLQATAIDPLKLFPEKARPSADELEQEQILQENMGDRDTRPGSLNLAGPSDRAEAPYYRPLFRIGWRKIGDAPGEVSDAQLQDLDDVWKQ